MHPRGQSRSTDIEVLRGIGRDLVSRFLYGFTKELAANHIEIPREDLGDTEFFTRVGDLFSGSVSLPSAITSTLAAIALMVSCSGSSPLQQAPHRPPPRYSIRKGLGMWHVTFEGRDTEIRHERGMFYVAWLLLNPPEHAMHALDLRAKVPEMYRQQIGLLEIADPTSGKPTQLESHARLQERSLSLDDAQAMRVLLRKQQELENILDDVSESEPIKSEALLELEQIYVFQRQHGYRSRDAAQKQAKVVRRSIHRLHENLFSALDIDGKPHPVLHAFAGHVERYILIPSARYSGCGGPHSRAGLAGCFTYEPPSGINWRG